MTVNRKVTGRACSVPVGIVSGVALSITVTVLVTAVAAHLISSEIIAQEQVGYCSMSALLLASCFGARTAAARVKVKPMRISGICGAVYYGFLLAITALFFGGQYQAMGVTLILVALGSGAGGLLAGKRPKQRRQKGCRNYCC